MYLVQARDYQKRTRCTNAQAASYALQLAAVDQFFIDESMAVIAHVEQKFDAQLGQLRAGVRSYGNFKFTDSLIAGLSDPNWPDEDRIVEITYD